MARIVKPVLYRKAGKFHWKYSRLKIEDGVIFLSHDSKRSCTDFVGLRCPERLLKGQFIDTYLGEIITLETAEERESTSSGKAKASYLYDLDKNSFDEEGNKIDTDHYVVDGEFFGNATRFMNHSCDPNCGQYVVSKNKYDTKIYDLAFFAKKDIPPQTELTFDYLDKDEGGEEDEQQKKGEEDVEGGIRCFCGAQNCRRWLWR